MKVRDSFRVAYEASPRDLNGNLFSKVLFIPRDLNGNLCCSKVLFIVASMDITIMSFVMAIINLYMYQHFKV